MAELVVTNIRIFKAIAEEAYEEMKRGIEAGRRHRPDGKGWIKSYDPAQATFKQAIVSIVFTGVWLEALTHLWIIRKFGESSFDRYDRKPYEEKLKVLGLADRDILERVRRFRKTRRELVHERRRMPTTARSRQLRMKPRMRFIFVLRLKATLRAEKLASKTRKRTLEKETHCV